jgi:flagellar biosynthetic protein FliR
MNETTVFSFMLILCRVSALIAFFPLFSRKQIPFSVKAGLSVALAVFWYGNLPAGLASSPSIADISPVTGSLLLIREIICGSLLGMIAGWFLVPARIAGIYIGQEMGLSMGQVLDPNGMESNSEFGRLFETIALLMFFCLNIHHWVFMCLHHSFEFIGASALSLDVPTGLVVGLVNQLDEFGLLVAAPVAIALAAINFAVLYLNRASPAMNIFTVGAPARILVGLFVLVLFWPVLVRGIAHSFDTMDGSLQKILSAYSG